MWYSNLSLPWFLPPGYTRNPYDGEIFDGAVSVRIFHAPFSPLAPCCCSIKPSNEGLQCRGMGTSSIQHNIYAYLVELSTCLEWKTLVTDTYIMYIAISLRGHWTVSEHLIDAIQSFMCIISYAAWSELCHWLCPYRQWPCSTIAPTPKRIYFLVSVRLPGWWWTWTQQNSKQWRPSTPQANSNVLPRQQCFRDSLSWTLQRQQFISQNLLVSFVQVTLCILHMYTQCAVKLGLIFTISENYKSLFTSLDHQLWNYIPPEKGMQTLCRVAIILNVRLVPLWPACMHVMDYIWGLANKTLALHGYVYRCSRSGEAWERKGHLAYS